MSTAHAIPDEFGLERIDVLDDCGDEPTLRLCVLWEAPSGMINLHVLATRNLESGNLTMVESVLAGAWPLRLQPTGIARWVEGDRKVWERCRAEWARYLEQRVP